MLSAWKYDGVTNTILADRGRYVFCRSTIGDSQFFSIFKIEGKANRFIKNGYDMGKMYDIFRDLRVKSKIRHRDGFKA